MVSRDLSRVEALCAHSHPERVVLLMYIDVDALEQNNPRCFVTQEKNIIFEIFFKEGRPGPLTCSTTKVHFFKPYYIQGYSFGFITNAHVNESVLFDSLVKIVIN